MKQKYNLRRQLRPIQRHKAPCQQQQNKILLPQIETNHYQYYQLFILAKALEARGAEIKVILCDSFLEGCEIKNVKNSADIDPCLACRFNRSHAVPLFRFNTVKLSDLVSTADLTELRALAERLAAAYPQRYVYDGIDIIPMTNDSVIRYFYGAVPTDDEPALQQARKKHLLTSLINIKATESIDASWSPDIVLNNMNVYSAWAPYYEYFKRKKDVALYTVSIIPFNYNSISLNIAELSKSSERYGRFIQKRGGHPLDAVERTQLTAFIDQRVQGNARIFRDYKYFDGTTDAMRSLGIDRAKRNIFLFSNVYWDVGMSESGRLFPDVITWVLETIDAVKDRDGVHLYIKPHPAEKFDSASSLKGIVDYITERFPRLPTNVTIIYPELRIKPYDLFPYIDLGIVYNGTLGLEMMLQSIPIVITGDAPYGRLGLAYEPLVREEYTRILTGEFPPIMPDKDRIELFAYFYFIKTCMPWDLTARAYGDDFCGYSFNTLEDIFPGKNKHLDHLCNCILDPERTVVEGCEDGPAFGTTQAS